MCGLLAITKEPLMAKRHRSVCIGMSARCELVRDVNVKHKGRHEMIEMWCDTKYDNITELRALGRGFFTKMEEKILGKKEAKKV
ncbi:hypothetical protein KIN20_012959 [Parelaphostrongylus tenuis]|uniref:Uncharacterized protein n=1 Tax=Parelaphostrongylus tenuis TaxID=148309 RepID=A0AAD5MFX0_PARTN|nr:hypothetical protein KIN20_012959 [Parelaphostrongylus tenuis]